jgi:hypothetical protein
MVCTSRQVPTLNMTFGPGSFPVRAAKMTDGRFLVLTGQYVSAAKHTNEDALSAVVRSKIAAGMPATPSMRILVGFQLDNGLRGWEDRSVEQQVMAAAAGAKYPDARS